MRQCNSVVSSDNVTNTSAVTYTPHRPSTRRTAASTTRAEPGGAEPRRVAGTETRQDAGDVTLLVIVSLS